MTFQTLQQPIPKIVRTSACLASSNLSNPTLYVTGGKDLDYDEMRNLQIWEANEWRDGPNMNYSRMGHGCIVVNEWLWVMGGYQYEYYRREMEAIDTSDIDSSSWELKGVLSSNKGINDFGIVAVDNLIYVIGGYNAENLMHIIDTPNGDVTTISMGFHVDARPVVAVDGIMYGFGGRFTKNLSYDYEVTDSWALYYLLSDEWCGTMCFQFCVTPYSVNVHDIRISRAVWYFL